MKELELQEPKLCNAQKTQLNSYLDPDISVTLFPRRPFISEDYTPPLYINKLTTPDFRLLTQPLPCVKSCWFRQALPQVSKIVTGSLQAQKFTVITSILAQLCGFPSILSIRSYRDCSPLRQGGGQYSSSKPELTQHLKVCYSSKKFQYHFSCLFISHCGQMAFSSFFISALVCSSQYKSPMYQTCK